MKSFTQGFGLTTGMLVAIIGFIGLAILALCCCATLYAASLPAGEARPTRRPTREATATLAGPTATPAPTPTPVILQFHGSGDDVIQFAAPIAGLAQFAFIHDGDGNFVVKLLDSQGRTVDLLVNEIGAYEGQKAQRLEAGQYLLEITANGGWSAIIGPPQ